MKFLLAIKVVFLLTCTSLVFSGGNQQKQLDCDSEDYGNKLQELFDSNSATELRKHVYDCSLNGHLPSAWHTTALDIGLLATKRIYLFTNRNKIEDRVLELISLMISKDYEPVLYLIDGVRAGVNEGELKFRKKLVNTKLYDCITDEKICSIKNVDYDLSLACFNSCLVKD